MKITSITWGSDIALLAEACAELGIALIAWTPHDLEDEWNADHHGLGSTGIGWSVAMPEFEGAIRADCVGQQVTTQPDGVAAAWDLHLQAQPCRGYSEIHSQARIRLELRLRNISNFTRADQTTRFM